MRAIFLALMLAACATATGKPETTNTGYDAALANRLGADERGMKMYVLVILKTGPATVPKAEQTDLFRGHMANIKRLADEGKLAVAGPFDENPSHYEGIFVFNVPTIEEAKSLLATDPAVARGLLAYDAYNWYGTAAMQELPALHARIDRTRQ